MEGQSRKLFALGLLGVAVALVVGGEAGVSSEEDDFADFVYRSRTLKSAGKSKKTTACSLDDKPVKAAPVKECMERCSNLGKHCPEFFVGTPWPPSIYGDDSTSCRICQTQEQPRGGALFATLYNLKYRIPEYTAANIKRPKRNGIAAERVDALWKRIQLGLCSQVFHNHLREKCKYGWGIQKWGVTDVSLCKSVDSTMRMEQCGDCQALYEDLDGCKKKKIGERGHLNPRKINDYNEDAHDATFSMINMAPQASKFNNNIWRRLEKKVIEKAEEIFKSATSANSKNKSLYVITGTKISNNDKWVRGRVLFPSFFWKALCYPGDESAKLSPFGVGVYGPNDKSTTTKEDITILSLPKFDEWLYGKGTSKHIFQGSVCDQKGITKWDPLP